MTGKRGRPPRKKTELSYEIEEYDPKMTIEAQMSSLGNAALRFAHEQLRQGTIAPSTLNKLIEFATPENEVRFQSLQSKTELDKSKVRAIEASNEEKVGQKKVLEELKGYRGNAFDERTEDDVIR